jgi:hypothetical protein
MPDQQITSYIEDGLKAVVVFNCAPLKDAVSLHESCAQASSEPKITISKVMVNGNNILKELNPRSIDRVREDIYKFIIPQQHVVGERVMQLLHP